MANSAAAPSKGVFARPRNDWSLSLAMGGAAALAAAASDFNVVALYNNAGQGQFLAVYGIYLVQNLTTGFVGVKQIQGTTGTLQGPGNPLVSGYPVQPGQIFTGSPATLPYTNPVTLAAYGAPTEITVDYPLWLLPPGWSLAAGTSAIDASMQVGFLWSVY